MRIHFTFKRPSSIFGLFLLVFVWQGMLLWHSVSMPLMSWSSMPFSVAASSSVVESRDVRQVNFDQQVSHQANHHSQDHSTQDHSTQDHASMMIFCSFCVPATLLILMPLLALVLLQPSRQSVRRVNKVHIRVRKLPWLRPSTRAPPTYVF